MSLQRHACNKDLRSRSVINSPRPWAENQGSLKTEPRAIRKKSPYARFGTTRAEACIHGLTYYN